MQYYFIFIYTECDLQFLRNNTTRHFLSCCNIISFSLTKCDLEVLTYKIVYLNCFKDLNCVTFIANYINKICFFKTQRLRHFWNKHAIYSWLYNPMQHRKGWRREEWGNHGNFVGFMELHNHRMFNNKLKNNKELLASFFLIYSFLVDRKNSKIKYVLWSECHEGLINHFILYIKYEYLSY